MWRKPTSNERRKMLWFVFCLGVYICSIHKKLHIGYIKVNRMQLFYHWISLYLSINLYFIKKSCTLVTSWLTVCNLLSPNILHI